MIKINDSGQYERIIGELEVRKQNIDAIFQEVTANMATIDDTDIWTGLAQKEFSNKYKELASNYEVIKNGLNTYTRFLRNIIEGYKEQERQAQKNIESNSVKLDVNS